MNVLSKMLLCSTIALNFVATPSAALASTVEQPNEPVVYEDETTGITVTLLYSHSADLKFPEVKESVFSGTVRAGGIPARTDSSTAYLAVGEKLPFEGSATSTSAFTNKNAKGLKTATIQITNKESKSMVAYLHKNVFRNTISDPKMATFNCPANTTMGWSVSGLSTDDYYYMQFKAPSSFKGFIWRNS